MHRQRCEFLVSTASHLSGHVVRFRVPTKPESNAVLPSLAFAPWIYLPSTASQYTGSAPFFFNWTSGMTATVGQYVVPEETPTNYINGYYYKCTAITTGIAGSNPAIFNGVTTIGNTVVDGGITWTCTGLSGELSQFGLDVGTYYNNGQPQTLEFDFDNSTGGLLAANAIDHGAYVYGIVFAEIYAVPPPLPNLNVVLHSLEIDFTNIVDLRFT